ncbi:hypothetical protein D3C72_2265450 [compost metagenome]
MRRLFVSGDRLLVPIGFINIKPRRDGFILQYVKTQVARLFYRPQVIGTEDLNKLVDFVLFNVNFYQCDVHGDSLLNLEGQCSFQP